MNRGMFKSLVGHDGYTSAEKDWLVELSFTSCHWYDLLSSPPPQIDTRKNIVDYLAALRQQVEESLEKRFIYFICTRKRVRFNTRKKPTYSRFTSRMTFHVLVGRDEKPMQFEITFRDAESGRPFKPTVEIDDRFIAWGPEGETKALSSIHDFLMTCDIDLGFPTLVQYVGYTQSPEKRPTNGSHTGLSDVLARVSNEENDVFLIFNLFKVLTKASNAPYMLNFIFANAMTDEIDVDLEGRIIEKCFISYFDSENQTRARDNERAELRNNLEALIKQNKINSVQFVYDVDPPTEYWKLGSSRVRPNLKHAFTVRLESGDILVEEGAPLMDNAASSAMPA
jgi:hypothetical protein